MARPSVLHPGFLIPNAGGVTSPQMAEPDQVDFNTLGNARYGVIEGCLVTVSGATATNTSGTALVNGQLVTMAGGQTVSLGSSGTQDRYDLVSVDTTGTLKLVPGTASNDPVFPDPPIDATVLAAVFCNSGSASYVNNVIDKRKFLPDSLLTKISGNADLVVNRNGTGNLFGINGAGVTTWQNDTILQWASAKTLRITENLNLDGNLSAGGALTAQSLVTSGRVTSSNLKSGDGAPTKAANPGDIFQSSSGSIYVYRSNGWAEIALVSSIVPVGTLIQSLQPPSYMTPLGWVALNGDTVSESARPSLFAHVDGSPSDAPAALQGFVTGVAPHRSMVLPNATNRVLMADFTQAATTGGSNTISVLLSNLPSHRHNTKTAPGGGYTPTAAVGRSGTHQHYSAPGGRHPHDIQQEPHKHNGMEGPNSTQGDVVGLFWGGQNKIDAYFNDRSHTFSVEAYQWTMPAIANVQVMAGAESDHQHTIDPEGDHTHTLTFNAVDQHSHTVTEQDIGGSSPITYQPAFLTCFVYVRA